MDPIILGSIGIGVVSIGLIGYSAYNGKSLNPLAKNVKSESPFSFADKFREAVSKKAKENDQIEDLQVSQLDNLLSHAVAHGREIERAKGKNSDTLYKMIGLCLLGTGLNLIGILILLFG